jgi:hypothetical protein
MLAIELRFVMDRHGKFASSSMPQPEEFRRRLPREWVLGGWHAGQLLDEALTRSMEALDRLAILLWSAACRQFERDRAGDLRLPAFRQGYLDQMSANYGQQASWPALRVLRGSLALPPPER